MTDGLSSPGVASQPSCSQSSHATLALGTPQARLLGDIAGVIAFLAWEWLR